MKEADCHHFRKLMQKRTQAITHLLTNKNSMILIISCHIKHLKACELAIKKKKKAINLILIILRDDILSLIVGTTLTTKKHSLNKKVIRKIFLWK